VVGGSDHQAHGAADGEDLPRHVVTASPMALDEPVTTTTLLVSSAGVSFRQVKR